MKLKLTILLLSTTLIALAAAGARRQNSFEPASDLPRGALVYVQVEDLPGFVKAVTESAQYKKFAASGALTAFSKGHLGIKLAKRLAEFSDTAGFGFNAGTLSTLAEKRAALALYDIGKLDFAIVAPMSDTVFAATQLAANRDRFKSEKLPDGTTLYRADVAADSGRQTQQLLFTHLRGRLIVATTDKLLNQTIANIDGKQGRSAIADEPSFRELASRLKPRVAAVWVDQTALNSDYYFKHYWLMSDRKELVNIRGGLFDLGIEANSVSERRLFLTDGSEKGGNIDPKFVATAMRFVPTDAPLYSIGPADAAAIDDAFAKTIFDRRRAAAETVPVTDNSIYGDKFEMRIDEEPAVEAPPAPEFVQPISSLFAKARTIVSFSRPKMLESPLFFETDRALIVIMKSSGDLDAALFEKLISDRFAKERAVGADRFKWRSDDGWRVLDLPFLGSGIRYRVDGRNIIVTNGFAPSGDSPTAIRAGEFSELTVVNLEQRGPAFDQVLAEFRRRGAEVGFFESSVGGMLDSAAPAKRIEIRKRSDGKIIEETLTAER